MAMNGSTPPAPVSVGLQELKNETVPFAALEDAFGPESLGIIIVKDLPERYLDLRQKVLSYSSYLANLPATTLDSLEQPAANYLVGWSLGKETLKSGHFDTLKGSYYFNCAFYHDASTQSAPDGSTRDFPEYTAPNVWPPDQVLPGFKRACEELCELIIDTATLVARACDRYAVKNIPEYSPGYLEHVVRTSMTTKARLLHYFPSNSSGGDHDQTTDGQNEDDDWCATHIDHGCLTGLTSAMFVDEAQSSPTLQTSPSSAVAPENLQELPKSPDPGAGLYIRSRTGTVTQVKIPRDCLAFQTGEALELITKGHFKAVPHFVQGVKKQGKGQKIARNTLAVFTQPNLWEVVDRDAGKDFEAFSREVVVRNQ